MKKNFLEVTVDRHSSAARELLTRFEADLRRLKPKLTKEQVRKCLLDVRWYECHEADGPNHYQLRLSIQVTWLCARLYRELNLGRRNCREKMYTTNLRTKIATRLV